MQDLLTASITALFVASVALFTVEFFCYSWKRAGNHSASVGKIEPQTEPAIEQEPEELHAISRAAAALVMAPEVFCCTVEPDSTEETVEPEKLNVTQLRALLTARGIRWNRAVSAGKGKVRHMNKAEMLAVL